MKNVEKTITGNVDPDILEYTVGEDPVLDRALVKWGLSMHYPKENQIVRFDSFGNLEPGQTSVALARARSQNSFSASVSAPGEVYSARRARAQAYSAPARQGESARQRLARARRR